MTPKELRSRRIALGLSIQDLAVALDVNPVLLQQMEKGQAPIGGAADLVTRLDAIARDMQEGEWRDFLVVEDDEAVRALFASRLRAEGCTVDEAGDGLEALDATATKNYRLMLLDLRLPKLSGAEVLARVVRKPGVNTNVIVISAAGSGDVREIANLKQVHAIVRKNFAIANLDVLFPALAAMARA